MDFIPQEEQGLCRSVKPDLIDGYWCQWYQDQTSKWWYLRWTGWQPDLNYVEGFGRQSIAGLVGQMLAYPVEDALGKRLDITRPMLYQSFPGGYGCFQRGCTFNLGWGETPDQKEILPFFPNLGSSPEDLCKAREWCYRRIMWMIEETIRFAL